MTPDDRRAFDSIPDGYERARFNAFATFELFGTPVTLPPERGSRKGHIVGVDVRDQFGLGDDAWLVQLDDGSVVTVLAGWAQVPDDDDVPPPNPRELL